MWTHLVWKRSKATSWMVSYMIVFTADGICACFMHSFSFFCVHDRGSWNRIKWKGGNDNNNSRVDVRWRVGEKDTWGWTSCTQVEWNTRRRVRGKWVWNRKVTNQPTNIMFGCGMIWDGGEQLSWRSGGKNESEENVKVVSTGRKKTEEWRQTVILELGVSPEEGCWWTYLVQKPGVGTKHGKNRRKADRTRKRHHHPVWNVTVIGPLTWLHHRRFYLAWGLVLHGVKPSAIRDRGASP